MCDLVNSGAQYVDGGDGKLYAREKEKITLIFEEENDNKNYSKEVK